MSRPIPEFLIGGLAAVGVLCALVGACSSSKADGSCTEALTAAEVVIDKSTDALDAAADAINGFLASDGEAIQAANVRLDHLGQNIEADADNYRRLAAECRGN